MRIKNSMFLSAFLLLIFVFSSCQQFEKKGCLRFFFDGVPVVEDILKEKNKFSVSANEKNITETEKENGLLYHPPYKEDKCIACHDFSGNNANLLKSERLSEICFQCHKKEKFNAGENEQIHMPILLGKCDICHTSHESREKALMKKPVLAICSQCHKGVAQEFSHFSAEKGTCVSCHNPHGKNKDQKYLKGVDKEVCGACHGAESIGSDNPKKDFLISMYKMPLCISCHKAVVHGKK